LKTLLAILFCSYAGAACAGERSIGRLFFTPSERADLERNRGISETSPAATADTESQPILKVNGFVRRNDEKSTVWVNRQAIQEGSSLESLNVGKIDSTSDKVTLGLAGKRKVTIMPGQHYDGGQIITSVPVSRGPIP